MNLRKIISKVVTTALIVTTVGVVQPATAYAADIDYEYIDVDGTNEWKLNEDFSADFTVEAKTKAGAKVNDLECTFALYEGTNPECVYHSTQGQKVRLDKNKTYRLEIYVSHEEESDKYFSSVERAYFNGLTLRDYWKNSGLTDEYFRIAEMETSVHIVKKLTYVSLINGFVANDESLDVGDISITGPNNWQPGDTFDGSKYKATAETGVPLSVLVRLEDADKNVLYDSETKKTPYKLEKGKWYRRWIFIYVGDGEVYTFGNTGKVKLNGKEYKHGFGPDKWSIDVESMLNYFKTADSITDLPDELDLGVVSVDGTLDWCDGEKISSDKITVKSSEEYNLNKHIRLSSGKEMLYDSEDPKYSNYTIKEGESYKLTVFVSIDNGDNEDWGFCWIGNVDALLVNGKSVKNYSIIDESNAIEYTYSFVAGKAKSVEVKKEEPKKEQPKVTAKKTQEVKIKVKAKTIKAKKAKKNLKIKKVFTIKGAQGTVSYQINKAKLKKQFKINKKGIITLKKKLKKGTYKVKVKVIVAGNNEYEDFSKVVTVKIKVK